MPITARTGTHHWRRLALAVTTLVFVIGAPPGRVLAQSAPAGSPRVEPENPPRALPPEYSEASRTAYAAAMKEAHTLLIDKQYAEAITRLDALSKQRPREPQARFLKGIALTELGRYDDAAAQFESLTADFPELPEPHNNLAALYARKGELQLARRELELAIAADPNYGIASENLGDIYMRLAAAQYERASTLERNRKSAPLKLKLVRDALAAKPETAKLETATPGTAKPGAATSGNVTGDTAKPDTSAPAAASASDDTKEKPR